jgi:NAD(P)-dependent dehydrogenase (short-subunit alcohol dehydrogenase family)
MEATRRALCQNRRMTAQIDRTGARIALVTGATRGIGAAVVDRLLEREWSVIGLARRPAAVDHERYRHLAIDLADAGTLAETIEREVAASLSDRRWTRIGLVNNAAAPGVLGPIESTDPAALLRHAAVNWVAPTWLIAFMLRRTPPQTPLRIVNVSSGAAVQAFPGLSDYCASKAALRMAGMVAAAELDSALRTAAERPDTAILSYEPGTVDTAMQEEARSRSLDENPWGRLFRDFHASGALVAPAVPAREIVDFLERDGHSRFTERRLSR